MEDGVAGVGQQDEIYHHGVDIRILEKPPHFDGDETQWKDWRFRFTNWIGMAEAEFPVLLEAAADKATEIGVLRGRQRQQGELLYVLLSTLLGGPCLRQLQEVQFRNGFEAWRLLSRDQEPRAAHRKVSALDRILHPAFFCADPW